MVEIWFVSRRENYVIGADDLILFAAIQPEVDLIPGLDLGDIPSQQGWEFSDYTILHKGSAEWAEGLYVGEAEPDILWHLIDQPWRLGADIQSPAFTNSAIGGDGSLHPTPHLDGTGEVEFRATRDKRHGDAAFMQKGGKIGSR